ncbi:MAG: putative glycoside hydrolase [bacterium]|nr:putative glycoside hydrolase [bacterium]
MTVEEVPRVAHLPTPSPLKALYMTSCVAGTPSWRESLKKLILETELNAVVIDIKDATGTITIPDEALQPSSSVKSGCKVRDIKAFIQDLHKEGIYVIGRLSVFQDSYYSGLRPDLAMKRKSDGGVWKDRKGLAFIDVASREYWDYIVRIATTSYEIGFDEINFDYIRYPSDGNMADVEYNLTSATVHATSSLQASSTSLGTRAETLEVFFSYLSSALADTGMKTSADLFGLTTLARDDLGIGQVLERALPYFDYIAPMVYPSHFSSGIAGYAKPAEHPYEIIKYSMSKAVEREQSWLLSNGLATSTPSKLRPWLQDFNLGATYDAEKVRAQIQATYDVGLTSWMLWAPSNKYTESALLQE